MQTIHRHELRLKHNQVAVMLTHLLPGGPTNICAKFIARALVAKTGWMRQEGAAEKVDKQCEQQEQQQESG